jgi:hypothetical protein
MTLDEKLQNLPARPGCYLHKNAKGEISYISKAKSLRDRVRLRSRELLSQLASFPLGGAQGQEFSIGLLPEGEEVAIGLAAPGGIRSQRRCPGQAQLGQRV